MPRQRTYATAADRQAAYRKRNQEIKYQESGRDQSTTAAPISIKLPVTMGTRRWRKAIEAAKALLHMVEQEMNAFYDERSEGWRDGEKGEEFQERLNALSEAHEQLISLLTDW